MIVVYGASGRTGRRVIDGLRKLAQTFVVAGRDPDKLRPLSNELGAPVRVARADDPKALCALMDGAEVVVNCAGPFGHTGLPVARAALEARVHYVDIAGEQAFQRELLTLDPQVHRAGLTFLTAQALELAPAFCGAHHLAERMPNARRVRTVHYFDKGGPGLSAGSLKSLLDIAAAPRLVYEGGRLQSPQRRAETHPETIQHPLFHGGERREYVSGPFPGADVLLLPREIPRLRDVECRVCLPGAASKVALGLFSLGETSRSMLQLTLPALHRIIRTDAVEAEAEAGAEPEWAVEVTMDGAGDEGRCTIVGRDGYASSGAIAALAADWLARGKARRAGVVSTSAAFRASEFLDGLADFGIRWDATLPESTVTPSRPSLCQR